ncbi:hypothetical protein HHK36_019008 [Tetracentron sinense]|uniref:Uncharacterized protein n=1 Tax=Tetracentron sinense TaxID=13715 RepID=A0A835D969_TETSI|nr:hypothetical protein HHK36_019008 [Tetracentron sinense]
MVHQETRKGPWTEQEDLQLVCSVDLFGDRRWDFIAKVSGLKVAGHTTRKRAISPSSSSNPLVDSFPDDTQIREGSLNSKEGPDILSVRSEQESAKGYSMDQIWKEIDSVEDKSSQQGNDGNKEDGCNISYSPLASPLWDNCTESPWRIEEEEIKKLLLPMGDRFVPCYQHGRTS